MGIPSGAAHRQRLRLHDLAPRRPQRHANRAAPTGDRVPALAAYHPQTCGKVERFHQTLKLFLARQPRPHTLTELQRQIDRFVAPYNDVRPHRARARMTPRAAYDARDKAKPAGRAVEIGAGVRVRRDRIDRNGKVTLRYRTRLHHIGIGKRHKGKRVIMLIDDLDVRVLTEDGEPLRRLTLDPSRDYQPQS